MKLLIIIPARKNSKRLKNKNIKKFNGNTLVENSILFAKKNFKKSKIIVSTDSSLIRKKSLKYGVLCPWLRPKKLSRDKSTTISVLKHALKWCENFYGKFEVVLLLQPTTPFRKKEDLKFCLTNFFKIKNYINSSLISVKSEKKLEEKYRKIINLNKKRNYRPNGSFYLIGRNKIVKKKTIFGKSTYGYLVKKKKLNIDIDTIEDFKLAKNFL